jgi:hypothetical protein
MLRVNAQRDLKETPYDSVIRGVRGGRHLPPHLPNIQKLRIHTLHILSITQNRYNNLLFGAHIKNPLLRRILNLCPPPVIISSC